jgi:transcriptional antiterminator
MLDLNDLGKKITWGKVAGLLDCSTRTIYRNLCGDLKREKQILNEEV